MADQTKNPELFIGGHGRPKQPGPDKEMPGNQVSVIRNETTGIMVSISRSIKTGKTADEITKVKLEGWAHDLQTALNMLHTLDQETQWLIKSEATLFGVQCPYPPKETKVEPPKEQPATPPTQ